MASPHVAGAAALLAERHPTWTVAEIKSALVQTGDAVHTATGREALSIREGGGVIDLPRADNPLVFSQPTGLSFRKLAPGAAATLNVTLTDAGGGAGTWSASALVQTGSGTVAAPATVDVPGQLAVTATAGTTAGDVAGFVILTRGADTRRIPFWFGVSEPQLPTAGVTRLTRPGTVRGTTKGGSSRVVVYRYPTGGDTQYPGPERGYRLVVAGRPANVGAVVLSGRAFPHLVFDRQPDHLAGYTGLPIDLNPYRSSYGRAVRVAGAVLPSVGPYELVFDSRSIAEAGPFTFRWWVNDVRPPTLRVVAAKTGPVVVRATDAGSGVDPSSTVATLDGKDVKVRYAGGSFRIAVPAGRHALVLQVSDYQEAKNMEDVAPILPNTTVLRTTVRR
jgi:hypothetical protein